MQDFCFHASDEEQIISALESVGLTTPGMDGKPRPVDSYCYDGQIMDQPGEYAVGTDGATTTVTAPTYLPGVYAKYRATDEQAAVIMAATLPAGVEIVDPPTGLPLFGGEWLGGPHLDDLKASKLAEIRAACDAALTPLAAAYPDREVQSWPQQVAEAKSLEADPTAAAPLIREMAAVRPSLGDTDEERVQELARRIRANAAAWSQYAGPIIGKRQALEDEVLLARTPAAVSIIVWV